MRSRRARRWILAMSLGVILLGAVYVGKIVQLSWMEENIWFRPVGPDQGEWRPDGLGEEDVSILAEDGVRLHGWYVPHPYPSAVILLMHGSGGNLAMEVGVLKNLRDVVGAATLIFDYRGYGKSAAAPLNEQGFITDARAARKWLAEKTGTPENEIVLMGRSMGTGVAVDLAAHDGAGALILQGSFSSLVDVAAHHYWWNPATALMRNRFASIEKIADYRGPVLFSHGRNDQVVPLDQAQRLFARANEPKAFIVFEGASHETAEPAEYYVKLRDFLRTHVSPPARN